MSHSHDHHAGATGRHRWRLAVAFGLVAAFFVVELVAAWASGSLALLSDAGHMAADVTTLGAALVATRIATRKDTTGRRTYGSYRAEVFASGLAVLLMIAVGVYIAVESIGRIGQAPELASGVMLVVGVIGLVVNVVCLVLLRAGASESLNVKGAYLEVIADSLGSIGVIAAALLVGWTGNAWWDTVIALAIAAFVVVRAVMLGREVLGVLGQHAPQGKEPAELTRALLAVGLTRHPELSPDAVVDAVRLLGAPPTYYVPPTRPGHTRHYLPKITQRTGNNDTELTLDSYAAARRQRSQRARVMDGR